MKTRNALLVIVLLTAGILLLQPELLSGQPPALPVKPAQTPIDGGLGLLAAAGGAYAMRKLARKRKE